MSTVLHPVGPNPPRVYWFRRFVVVVGLVVVLGALSAIIWAIGFRDGGTAATATGLAAGTTPAATSPSDDGAVIPVDCAPADLELTLASDAEQYPEGANPVLQGFVTNTGSNPCTVDAGDAAREVVISSGTDRIWSTKDCATVDTASRQLLLAPGARDPFEIEWSRIRSADGCPVDLPAPRAGTYQVNATLLGATATPVAFVLS